LPWSLLGTLAWTTSFTLIGYAFSNSFSAAAGLLTHGALALAVLAAAALVLREYRRARRVRVSI
jgi:membrane protein DedA with SNARE-associated domain